MRPRSGSTLSGGTGTVELTALVQEAGPDEPSGAAAPRDISLAEVTMTLVRVGPGSPVTSACANGPVTGAGQDATLSISCTFTNAEVNTFTVEATVNGGCYVSAMVEDVVVVYDPSLGFTTGGGWFYWPGTTDKTNFGYTISATRRARRYRAACCSSVIWTTGLPGQVQLPVRAGARRGRRFRVSVVQRQVHLSRPGDARTDGNHEFIVYVEDGDEPGDGPDRFWIGMHDKSMQ